MTATLGGAYTQPAGARVGWRFDTPADLTINSITVWRTSRTIMSSSDLDQGPVSYVSFPSGNFTPDARTWCWAVQGCTAQGTQTEGAPWENSWWSGNITGLTEVHVSAGCAGPRPCAARSPNGEPMADARIQAVETHLTDALDPQVGNVRGTLAESGAHQGVERVSFDAHDAGSGLYRSFVDVAPAGSDDFKTRLTQPVDTNDGRCVELDHYAGYAYEFGYRVPCKLSVAEDVWFDTATLPDGDYELRVRIEDASGNSATALGPERFTVRNTAGAQGIAPPRASGGEGSSVGPSRDGVRLALRGARRRSLPFGRSTHLAATLRDGAGRAIPGASVGVLERKGVPGARWVAARSPLITDAEGRVRWTAPPGFSRRIRLVYRADPSDPGSQAITEVALKVRSKTSLRGNRSFLHNGGTLKFTGRLLSRPVPRGGVVVELQARVGSGWVTFKTRRTARDGRWRAHYRFHATSGLQTYRFRARVRRDTGFAYEPSASRTIRVKVRG